jgi:hypothetical protein
VREHLRAVRARSEQVAEQLRSLRPAEPGDPGPGPRMVLEFGIAFNEWLAGWWADAEERIAAESPAGAGT